MKKIKVIIVEDEAPARDLIKAYLLGETDVELMEECENGFDGIKSILKFKPDLIFLDIQMPKLSGFEMLELLDDYPQIIFTTAYDRYAIKAFELNATDYLMKPFSKERFLKALSKARNKISERVKENSNIKQLVSKVKEQRTPIERIFVKTGSRIDVIPVSEIIRINAQDDYAEIVTKNKSYLKKETMNFLEKNLPKTNFIRIHRSSIINSDYIDKIEKYGKESYLVVLKDGSKINVSKSRIKELKTTLGI
ncbi:MAG TPA: response regulator [Bacteroidales bacterium]|nr:response regulator [Bacteroidales bacterium]